jgi:hypothetical protein
MVWFDDKGRMKLSESTCSGYEEIPAIKECVSTFSGYAVKK